MVLNTSSGTVGTMMAFTCTEKNICIYKFLLITNLRSDRWNGVMTCAPVEPLLEINPPPALPWESVGSILDLGAMYISFE